MDACMEVDGRVGERRGNIYIYQKGYQHGQAIQLLSVIMLHDLCGCVCLLRRQCFISYYSCPFLVISSIAVIEHTGRLLFKQNNQGVRSYALCDAKYLYSILLLSYFSGLSLLLRHLVIT